MQKYVIIKLPLGSNARERQFIKIEKLLLLVLLFLPVIFLPLRGQAVDELIYNDYMGDQGSTVFDATHAIGATIYTGSSICSFSKANVNMNLNACTLKLSIYDSINATSSPLCETYTNNITANGTTTLQFTPPCRLKASTTYIFEIRPTVCTSATFRNRSNYAYKRMYPIYMDSYVMSLNNLNGQFYKDNSYACLDNTSAAACSDVNVNCNVATGSATSTSIATSTLLTDNFFELSDIAGIAALNSNGEYTYFHIPAILLLYVFMLTILGICILYVYFMIKKKRSK